jgi:hypothetical protein
MPNTTTSQYMGMPVPVPTVDPGPQWATDLNTCLTTVDQHDHSTGKGTPVTPSGLNINSDLNFNANNAIGLRSSRYNVQASPLSGVSDLGCLYVSGVDLYYNDENGNQIRMTASGSVSGTAGSITGLVPPANVTYTGFNQTFTFQSSTATAASLDGGSVTIRNLTASSPGITLSPPASLASNYTITFPNSLPSSSSYFITDPNGNISSLQRRSPTFQKFTGSSGTYVTPSGVFYLKVSLIGGGGGGGGQSGFPSSGTNSSFGTNLLVAIGGAGGSPAAGGDSSGGIGGFGSLGGSTGIIVKGSDGASPGQTASIGGGTGGMSFFGGAAAGGTANFNGYNASFGSGGGGSGGTGASAPGGGGGAGGYVKAYIKNPLSTYAYVVGSSGSGGTGTPSGGNGGVGYIEVEEYYF